MCSHCAVSKFQWLWVVACANLVLASLEGLVRSETGNRVAVRKTHQRYDYVKLEHEDSDHIISLSLSQSGNAAQDDVENRTHQQMDPLDVKRASGRSESKLLQNVLFYDFDSPYRNERSDKLGKRATDWMVLLRPECAEEQQSSVCVDIPGEAECLTKGDPRLGIGFVHMRASQEALQVWLSVLSEKARSCVNFVEADAELGAASGEPKFEKELTARASATEDPRRRISRTEFGNDLKSLPPNRGEGVQVYIADTGVRCTHKTFVNPDGSWRATPAIDATKAPIQECGLRDESCAVDRHGHGTYSAGIAAGHSFGVAPAATVRAVKILNDHGKGTRSALLAALDWVISKGGTPAVFSLGVSSPGVSHAVEVAIQLASQLGITVVVAAGNSNEDACGFAPAYVHGAITVGASDHVNAIANFSNYGNCVDLFVPGMDIESPGNADDTSSAVQSSTAVAGSLVTGAAALILSDDHKADVKSRLLEMATPTVTKTGDNMPIQSFHLNDDFFGLAKNGQFHNK